MPLGGPPRLLSPRATDQLALSAKYILLCLGIGWLFWLPLDSTQLSLHRPSENALLPGQVNTYFGLTETTALDNARDLVQTVSDEDSRVHLLQEVFSTMGVRYSTQKYNSTTTTGGDMDGTNFYAVVEAPRGDGTESILLIAPWTDTTGQDNRPAVALAMALVRYFHQLSLWSKDIIVLFPQDSDTGMAAFLAAYYDDERHSFVSSSLPMKAGSIQAAIAIELPFMEPFTGIEIVYEGVNGQLPNLDLIYTSLHILKYQFNVPVYVQGSSTLQESGYMSRFMSMLRGMLVQAPGRVTGAHSVAIPYRIDSLTLRAVKSPDHEEHHHFVFGMAVEGILRSLNNLLERFHQSFFLYLLLGTRSFVSVGMYLPSAMLVASAFTVQAIHDYMRAKRASAEHSKGHAFSTGIVAFVGLYVFTYAGTMLVLQVALASGYRAVTVVGQIGMQAMALIIGSMLLPRNEGAAVLYFSCFSRLSLGMGLSSLATLNYPLAFFVAVAAFPIAVVRPARSRVELMALLALTLPANPIFILQAFSTVLGPAAATRLGAALRLSSLWPDQSQFLTECFTSYRVHGAWVLPTIVYLVWLPSYICALAIISSGCGKACPQEKVKTT